RAINGGLSSGWSNLKQITTPVWTSSLSGSFVTAAGSYNFTSLGSADWAHWTGINADGTGPSMVHKSVGGNAANLISNVARYPSANNVGHYGTFTDTTNETQMTWTDGTPVASASNERTKLWGNAATLGQGWTFSVPADSTSRTLSILAGGYFAGITINAHLSDSSFPDYSWTDPGASGLVRQVYTFTYAAASAGQSLIITLTKSANNGGHTDGSLDLLGAWLTAATAAPSAPAMTAASDSGVSSTDGITRITTPTFTGTAPAGTTVKIYSDGSQVGSGTASGGAYNITTSALVDGVHSITATATSGSGASSPSGPLSITIDTVAPTVSARAFNFQQHSQNLTYDLSEDLSGSLGLGDLTLANLTTSSNISAASMSLNYDGATHHATISFPGFAYGALPDGNYRATLAAASVTDAAGNPLAASDIYNFFFLNGDANHDRVVDAADLGILSTNWQGTGKTFAQGDFNYDGVVNVTDLDILASRWQHSLPTPVLSPAPKSDLRDRVATQILDG
ncbi:MAG TPA: Ig-like domain-containing protein, partial [Tepidisphaeraceae bacterium]